MNTYAEKLELIHWITELTDISILAKVRSIKENTPVMSDSEALSIEKGLDDLQHGRVLSHLYVKKRYENWL